MEPEVPSPPPQAPAIDSSTDAAPTLTIAPVPSSFHWLLWAFIGADGLRAGWSVLIFSTLIGLIGGAVGYAFVHLHLINLKNQDVFSASSVFASEAISFAALAGAAALVALIERRRNLLAFNLTGPRSAFNFLSGLVVGFLALSALVGALAWGGWLHFGPAALSGAGIFKYGALWAAGFLLVGCNEEGLFRCYLQFTLTRGINFWWASGINALLCLFLAWNTKGNGVWGVYLIAMLGLLPCLFLHLRNTPRSGFWQASWVTSTLFGMIHTSNGGENWIGILAAALIGFVFCVSIYVTGSAWWAIGCHAAWDWAQSFFYGTADSGHAASGHYLTTSPAGNALLSGGADGPEGSVLVLAVVLLLLVLLLAMYGRKKSALPFATEAAR